MLYNKDNIIETKNVNILETVTHLVWSTSDEMESILAMYCTIYLDRCS